MTVTSEEVVAAIRKADWRYSVAYQAAEQYVRANHPELFAARDAFEMEGIGSQWLIVVSQVLRGCPMSEARRYFPGAPQSARKGVPQWPLKS